MYMSNLLSSTKNVLQARDGIIQSHFEEIGRLLDQQSDDVQVGLLLTGENGGWIFALVDGWLEPPRECLA